MARRAAAGLAAALALLLTGCVGIPTGGAVGSAPIDLDDDGGDIITRADPPQRGATPSELLAGFLTAQRAPQGNYSVARQFLTDAFRTEWSPSERVLVSDTPIVPEQRSDTQFELQVSVDALVGSAGNYTELAEPEQQLLEYEFEQDADGEWRISAAPAGILVSSNQFDRDFGAYPLYFYDPSGDYLVPDLRWFPQTSSRADRIVKELLAGQSAVYQNGVLVTAFPPDTKIDGGVTISQGAATVDLAGDIASQDQPTRWRMQQQLVASLSALSEVSSVQLTVGGFPVDVGDGAHPDSTQAVRSDPLGLTEGGFGYLTRDNVDRIAGISQAVEELAPLGATLGRSTSAAAVRSAQGAWIVAADGAPVLVDDRAGIIDPGLDERGYLWSAVGSSADSIVAVNAEGDRHTFASPNLDGQIVALDVSRDSARLIIATQTAGGPELTLVGIVRDGNGAPVGLGEPLAVTVGSGRMLDAAWVDASTVAVLSGDGDVDLYRLGGRHESYGTVADGVQLVGGNLAEGIRVRVGDGTVWRHISSGGWQATGIVASFLGTQQ
ncbi:MAG: LpqB family beta-propeller domain-containing protein [Protaetiibacter sp.]